MRGTGLSAALALLARCADAPPPAAAGDGGGDDLGPGLPTTVDGHVVPTDATVLRAPPHQVRILTWSGNWGLSQIDLIVADGKKVEEADVVVEFNFKHDDLLDWVHQRQRQASAESEKSAIESQRRLDELLVEARQREIAAARAAVDVQRKGVVSAIQSQIYELDFRLARFEEDAAEKRVAAHRLALEAEERYHERNLAYLAGALEHFDFVRSRFALRAPHGGIVRHAYHPWHRRKIQKGDGLRAGMEVIHIARDESLSVEVFVPEHRMGAIRRDLLLAVLIPATGERYRARVDKIPEFPQEIGFLRKDDSLPNAREKAYSVRAEFIEPPQGLLAGNEVKVEIP